MLVDDRGGQRSIVTHSHSHDLVGARSCRMNRYTDCVRVQKVSAGTYHPSGKGSGSSAAAASPVAAAAVDVLLLESEARAAACTQEIPNHKKLDRYRHAPVAMFVVLMVQPRFMTSTCRFLIHSISSLTSSFAMAWCLWVNVSSTSGTDL